MSPLFCFLTLFFIFSHCKADLGAELVDGSNNFGYDLTNSLYSDSLTSIWISPFCITSCFALIYPGSAGNTRTEIASVLGYPTEEEASDITQEFFILQSLIESSYNGGSESSIIGIANKLYVSSSLTLKQDFIDALDESFITYNFDFSSDDAIPTINNWVYNNTNGLIERILEDDADIAAWLLVAMNAIYLNGTFQLQFEEYMTSLSPFYSDETRKTETDECHLMHQIEYFDYYNNGNYQFLKFKFDDINNDLFVLFVLPINNDLDNNGLITDYGLITTAINNLKDTRIALALPKISIEASYRLNSNLINLGMIDAFDGNADFSNIAEGVSLKIDVVIHKTMIEMDEKGLVAAAVTLIGMDESAVVSEKDPILFKADHPFQMFIIDGEHDNTILFCGQINIPNIPDGANTPSFDESEDDVWTDYESYQSSTSAFNTLCISYVLFITLFNLISIW